MNTYGITDRTYKYLLHTFKRFPEVKEVLLFGSRAKGNYKKGSDIDLAIKGKNVNPELIFKLKTIFNERLPIPYKVDVIGYDYLSYIELKDHILRVGKVIYSK